MESGYITTGKTRIRKQTAQGFGLIQMGS